MGDYDDDYRDEMDFRDPGGRSALRAGKRCRPCPTRGRKNALTVKDVQLGHQCDAEGAMLKALNESPDPGRWPGCRVTGFTCLGQRIERTVELREGELVLVPLPLRHPGTCT
jgi:hypothetical protein